MILFGVEKTSIVRMNEEEGLIAPKQRNYQPMKYEYKDSRLGAILGFTDDIKRDEQQFSITSRTIKFLWNRNDRPLTVQIDGMDPGITARSDHYGHLSAIRFLFRNTLASFGHSFQ